MKRTIDKYYCDRCGKEISQEEAESTSIDVFHHYIYLCTFDVEKQNFKCNVDLCDKCKKELSEWWGKK